jgi:hypothetical protein
VTLSDLLTQGYWCFNIHWKFCTAFASHASCFDWSAPSYISLRPAFQKHLGILKEADQLVLDYGGDLDLPGCFASGYRSAGVF